jgi:predicted DNA-binding transcriptional regulator YafY
MIRYVDLAGGYSERIIWPIGLAYFNRARVVMAWCELRQDFRSFRPDRMDGARVLEHKAPQRRAVLLKRWRDEALPDTARIRKIEKTPA